MTTERVGGTIGSARASRLMRAIGAFVLLALDTIVLPVVVLLAVVFFVIDLIWGFITNNPVDEGGVLGWLTVLFRWWIQLHHYVLFGDNFPGYIPSRRRLR